MYDEHIQRSVRRSGVKPLRFETGTFLADLVENFGAENPLSVVLTGTAGDGKTYLCRELWSALGGDAPTWEVAQKVLPLALPGGRTLKVIRDLSEFRGEDYAALSPMASTILAENRHEVFLVAANDGQLVEAWNRVPSSPEVLEVRQIIEALLVSEKFERTTRGLRLHNLSRLSSADLCGQIIDAVLSHEGWKACDGCRGQWVSTTRHSSICLTFKEESSSSVTLLCTFSRRQSLRWTNDTAVSALQELRTSLTTTSVLRQTLVFQCDGSSTTSSLSGCSSMNTRPPCRAPCNALAQRHAQRASS
jgi:hypothetical protein